MIGIIYKAQNEQTGEVYIGATTNSMRQRELDHTERANRGESSKFHNALSTFGKSAFNWEQVDTASSNDELAQKEKKYILEYNSKKHGYNTDSGGGFRKTVYKYSIVNGKLLNTFDSLASAGKSINTNKQHISRACLSVNNNFGGFYWSYEYKEPFIPTKDCRKKEVYQLSLEGYLLARYTSVSEASRQTGISKTCISRVCRNERKHSGGFRWAYN